MKSIQQTFISNQRKKCPRPGCFWISTTEKSHCPKCGHALTSAKGSGARKFKTILRQNSLGEIIEDNRHLFPSKWDFKS